MEKFLSSVKNFFEKAWVKIKSLFEKVKEKTKNLCSKLKNSSESSKNEGSKSITQKVLTAVGAALCVLFSFLLVCNMVIIIRGSVAPEKPPSVFGITPMVVLSGSMSGDAEDHIEAGDLIFVGKADPDKLEVGDVIAFMEGSTTVTHRIIREETLSDGDIQWITKGDANNTEDANPVTKDNLVGIYQFRLAGVGNFALFLQKPVGMLIFIGIPCLAFIVYDIIRRQRSAVKQSEKTSEMEAELERLRKLVGDKDAEAESDEVTEDTENAENSEDKAE